VGGISSSRALKKTAVHAQRAYRRLSLSRGVTHATLCVHGPEGNLAMAASAAGGVKGQVPIRGDDRGWGRVAVAGRAGRSRHYVFKALSKVFPGFFELYMQGRGGPEHLTSTSNRRLRL
jgi:hypothetical protein